ncbi:MAG: hypothetical protein RBG13Loki_0471 [Promethearchaeota archaeon CR_4]|nr:MAG: hypothetical protein RBG13Loki_0471 [Candidatus Lokiarchaeota archaeon CR_4]
MAWEPVKSPYIIQNTKNCLVKIGRSANPTRRIKTIEKVEGAQMAVLKILYGNREEELRVKLFKYVVLHEWYYKTYSIWHVSYEWFSPQCMEVLGYFLWFGEFPKAVEHNQFSKVH